jgi:hypothetical protein
MNESMTITAALRWKDDVLYMGPMPVGWVSRPHGEADPHGPIAATVHAIGGTAAHAPDEQAARVMVVKLVKEAMAKEDR